MKRTIIPSFCLGAIEGIEFLLNEYKPILDKNTYDKHELEKAKTKFVALLDENKYIKDAEGTEEILRLKGFKWAIKLYGKLFVSKNIENDLTFINVNNHIDETLNEIKNDYNDDTKKVTR